MQFITEGYGKVCPLKVGLAKGEIHITQRHPAMPPSPLGSG